VKTAVPPNAEFGALRAGLDATTLRDRRALLRALDRLAARADVTEEALAGWKRRVQQAQGRYAARAASVPQPRIAEDLPIAARADEIVASIRKHQVLVLAGETGSGKSTQLPKLCLAAGRGIAGLIGCTQPRRMAARGVARRVASELGTQVGALVGYQVRFTEQVGEQSLIKFMTDGILLAETQSDPWLNAYDTIILDEAHERSLNIDFLLGFLKRLLARRRDLKLIVTSATIDTARFAHHFDNAPVVEVEGRSYPVEVRWRPMEVYAAAGRGSLPSPAQRGKVAEGRKGASAGEGGRSPDGGRSERDLSQTEQIIAALDEITREDPRGDALIFLPGEREIRDTHLALSRRNYRATEILPLYARLSANEQDRVFKPGPARRIVLATNVAETSLTVPRIRYVVDTGTARVKRYTQRNQLERLHIEPISQAAAEQRKGRCGRVGPGVCVRLYGEDDFNARPHYGDPEILRSSLAGVILRMLALKLGDVDKFPFVEPPNTRAVGDGYRRLAELGAIDEHKRLTDTGRRMARLPVDVALARMLIEAQRLGVQREVLILASFLSTQDPRERPADARAAADAAHAVFADPKSDFVSALNLWHAHALAHEDLTQSKLRDWCRERFLSYLRMREWRELHRQLLVMEEPVAGSRESGGGIAHLESARTSLAPSPPSQSIGERAAVRGKRSGNFAPPERAAVPPPHPTLSSNETAVGEGLNTDSYEAVHRSLLSGWPTQVGLRDERSQYRGTRERKFQIFPGSALARPPPGRSPSATGRSPSASEAKDGRERPTGRSPSASEAKDGRERPQWVLAGQIIDLQKVYGMLCARIEPEWIEQQAAHLVKRAWRDPHWSRKRGAVLAFEQVTLFGLTLVEKRSVQFGRQDEPLAHATFVREALARCEIDARADCVRANRRVLEQAHELEAKRRRSGLVKDEAELALFFAGKLPADINTSAAFDAWYRNASSTEQAALHWPLDFVLNAEPGLRASDFPTHLDSAGQEPKCLGGQGRPGEAAGQEPKCLGGQGRPGEAAAHALKLEYRFVPGDAADGVTLHVPLAFVNAVPAARCEWLVPGLLAEKVAELIRGLPKSLRRNFVPAPDFARAFVDAEAPRDEPLARALAAYLQRVTGIEISAPAFADVVTPVHLSMRFRVYDERGSTLAQGRDIEAIRAQWGGAANAAFSRRADAELTREEVDEFDFIEIPERVTSPGGLTAFPALVDLGDSVALRVFERTGEARAAHARGVERLLRRALHDPVKQARRQLPIERRLALKYAGIASVESLREDVVEAALGELLAASDLGVRRREAFRELQATLARNLFPAAVEWLKTIEDVLAAYAELAPWLEPPLMGYARANYEDLQEQLDALVHPGFVREVGKARLRQFPRYLKALRLRAERLRQDATRDQARMLTVRGYWRDYLKLRAARGGSGAGPADNGPADSGLDELRWLIEELRVSLFAQELKTAEPVSPKRLAALVSKLSK
jgi:ATP-dependent helicase HrpA